MSDPNRYSEDSVTFRVENTIAELQQVHRDLTAAATTVELDSDLLQQVMVLEQAASELCVETESQLQNKKHVLLIPCFQLHLDCCDLVLQENCSTTGSRRIRLLGRIVVTAQKLLEVQTLFHGPDHFDLARTCNDLAQAVDELLSVSPKHLISLGVDSAGLCLSSTIAWSGIEHSARTEYKRIKALYPYDAEKYIP
jgi:hypothetical protein